jgi:hypothetical protein
MTMCLSYHPTVLGICAVHRMLPCWFMVSELLCEGPRLLALQAHSNEILDCKRSEGSLRGSVVVSEVHTPPSHRS